MLATILTVIFILLRQSNQLVYTSAYVAHTNEVLYNSQKVLAGATENETAVSNYLLTGNRAYLIQFASSGDSIRHTLARLRTLTADNPQQTTRTDTLQYYITKSISAAQAMVELSQKRGLKEAADAIETKQSNDYFRRTQNTIYQIEAAENTLLAERKNASQLSAAKLENLLRGLAGIVLVLLFIVSKTIWSDFLALRKSEKKRGESEEQLRLLLANVKDFAIFTTDINGNIVTWNEGATMIKGYSWEEIAGKNMSIFYTSDQINQAEPKGNLSRARVDGHFETQGWRVRKDGGVFWGNEVFTALYDNQQRLKGFACITRDITEQQLKQEEINYLSNLVEQTSDAIFSVSPTYIVRSWNKAAEKLYGYTREQAIGKPFGKLMRSRLSEEQRVKAIEDLTINGFYQLEAEYTHRNGNTIAVMASITSIHNENGEVTGYVAIHKDITERKKLEAQLISFNEQLEDKVRVKTAEVTDIFERISDAFMAFDNQWNYTYINKKAGELFRRDPASLLGKNLWNEFPDAVGSDTWKMFHTALSDQQYCSNIDYYAPFDLWHENYIYPSANGISVFIKNITDQKKAEEEVNRANERFQLITNATNDVVWDYDVVSGKIWWNQNFYSRLGYERNSSNEIGFWQNSIHPEDSERVTTGFSEAMLTGEPYWSDEYRFLAADGSPVFFLNRGYILYDKENKPYRAAGAMVDVTLIRKAEEKIVNNEKRFRALLQNSAEGLMLTDAKGIVLDISPSGATIFGYSYDEIVGRTCPDLVHPDDLHRMGDAFVKVLAHPGAVSTNEYRHKWPDGSYRWMECSYKNLLHEPYVNAVVLNYRDVTARKLAEEKIRTNEQMLLRAQEIGQFGSWEYDALTHEINWSDSMYKIHGKTSGARVSLESFFQQVYPDDIKKIKNVFWNLHEKEQRYRDEYRFLKNGELRFAHTTIDAVFENGKFRKAMGVVQDITENKNAQELIVQSEARYRKAQAQGKLGHWELDIKNRQLFLSDEIYSIYHLQPGCMENGYETFLGTIHPEDREIFEKEMAAAVQGQKNMDVVHRIVRKDGSIQFMHEVAELLTDNAGQPLKLTGMAQDITDQKMADEKLRRSEHKYRLLFENNPMPMWMSSIPDLNIIDVNKSALRQYGYTREEFLQLNSFDLGPEEEDANLFLQDAAHSPAASRLQWRHKKKDGSIIYVEIFNYQIMYEDRPVWLGLSIDVTEKNRAEALLKKSYEDIRQLASHLQDIREEERAHIAREIHDELGQQLTGLKMDISWLSRKKDLDAAGRDKKIKEILSFLDGTVNTVRKLSAELRPSILDDLGLAEALEWWGIEFEKRSGIACSFTAPAQHLQVPTAIAIGLFRIYQESLTNVARHAQAKNVFSQLELNNNQLLLKITDNGKGFDSSNIGHKKTLGLLGMKERTLMMGGSYEITSEPGKGTTVIISAPFDNPDNLQIQ